MSKLRLLSILVGIIVGAGMISGAAAEESFSVGRCMGKCINISDKKMLKDCKYGCKCKMQCSNYKEKEREAQCIKSCDCYTKCGRDDLCVRNCIKQ